MSSGDKCYKTKRIIVEVLFSDNYEPKGQEEVCGPQGGGPRGLWLGGVGCGGGQRAEETAGVVFHIMQAFLGHREDSGCVLCGAGPLEGVSVTQLCFHETILDAALKLVWRGGKVRETESKGKTQRGRARDGDRERKRANTGDSTTMPVKCGCIWRETC